MGRFRVQGLRFPPETLNPERETLNPEIRNPKQYADKQINISFAPAINKRQDLVPVFYSETTLNYSQSWVKISCM